MGAIRKNRKPRRAMCRPAAVHGEGGIERVCCKKKAFCRRFRSGWARRSAFWGKPGTVRRRRAFRFVFRRRCPCPAIAGRLSREGFCKKQTGSPRQEVILSVFWERGRHACRPPEGGLPAVYFTRPNALSCSRRRRSRVDSSGMSRSPRVISFPAGTSLHSVRWLSR